MAKLLKTPSLLRDLFLLMAEITSGILLDTTVLVAHLRGKLDLWAIAGENSELYLSLVTLGELYKGAYKSSNPAKNVALIDELLLHVSLLFPDTATAHSYARTVLQLEQVGTPIPQNDVWIAAVALECDLPVATRDAHFEKVSGLQVLRW